MQSRTSVVFILFFSLFSISALFAADPFTVYNETDQDLYMAIYYVPPFIGKSSRATSIVMVKKHGDYVFQRPKLKIGYDRDLLFNPDKFALKARLSRKGYNKLPSKNVGAIQGKYIYIAEKDGKLSGYNLTEWKVVKPTIEMALAAKDWSVGTIKGIGSAIVATLTDPIKNKIKKGQQAFAQDPYKDTVATVRVGNELNNNERRAVNSRLQKVKSALEKKLGKPIEYTPKIAFIASGGGYRAMICTLGFLAGAQQIGLLDATTWMSALSGSTWALGLWLSTAQKTGKALSVADFRNQFFDIIAGKELYKPLSASEIALLTNAWLVRAALGQPFTLVSIYGALLANRLLASFGDKRHIAYLSQQANLVQSGQTLIPIYTAIQAESGIKKENIEWYEFTPWEVGGAWLKTYVPTWAYGREFDKGKSIDFGIEKTLGFNLGTYGSAFALTVEDIYKELKSKITSDLIKAIFKKVVEEAGTKRLTWAEVFNFSKNVTQSPMKNANTIKLADAGLAFNLPYPPVSGERPERKADMLIFLDASYNVKESAGIENQLRGVEAYARRKKLKFPKINYEGIGERAISVFKDEKDSSAPVVIYMPRANDKTLWSKLQEQDYFAEYAKDVQGFDVEQCVRTAYCDTFNFKYTKAEAMRLSKITEFNMHAVGDVIFKEIDALIQRKTVKK